MPPVHDVALVALGAAAALLAAPLAGMRGGRRDGLGLAASSQQHGGGSLCFPACYRAPVNDELLRGYFLEEVQYAARSSCLKCLDASAVLFATKPSYERQGRSGLLVDVGANVGRSAEAMLAAFGAPMLAVLNETHLEQTGEDCLDENGPATLHCFEPNPGSFALLRERVERSKWNETHRVHLWKVALSNAPGRRTLFSRGAGDLMASFSDVRGLAAGLTSRMRGNGTAAAAAAEEVDVETLDGLFGPTSASAPRGGIHLLKVDAEGHDPLVLQGAKRLLQQKSIKFLVFEYEMSSWIRAEHRIDPAWVTAELEGMGYYCFLITKHALIPLSGKAGLPTPLRTLPWGNVFCGQSADMDLFDAYVAYGTNRYTLAYALAHLASRDSAALLAAR